jgi:quercetin dioxygenase-like cupin family protein
MNHTPIALLACLAAATAAAPLAATAQDIASTAKHARVVLDNDRMRVVEVELAPGESTGMHSHGDNLVVFVSGGAATATLPDGSTKSMDGKAGEVKWSGPITHDTKNTGTKPSKSLVIELKGAGG